MRIIYLESTDSTNSWLSRCVKDMNEECLVYAFEQTSGRGQRGNCWEAQPGENLTASILLYPDGIEPARQFSISEGVALAVVDVLKEMGVEAKVKWPNDIYVGDRKICGILIEHAVMGRSILHTIAGVGINLNQKEFLSNALNPVSVWQLTGRHSSVEEVAGKLASHVARRIKEAKIKPEGLHREYLRSLWRGDGCFYPFSDKTKEEKFEGKISEIAPDGMLTLFDSTGRERRFAFKEVEFLLM